VALDRCSFALVVFEGEAGGALIYIGCVRREAVACACVLVRGELTWVSRCFRVTDYKRGGAIGDAHDVDGCARICSSRRYHSSRTCGARVGLLSCGGNARAIDGQS
jgi:hypothetical protein